MSRSRDIATFLGKTEIANTSNVALASIDAGSGLEIYATLDDLPTTGLTSGDQAYIEATNRIYISNGSGWYNVALLNATPSLTIDPTGAVELSIEGANTIITLTGTDSDNADASLTYSVDSDGNFGGLATISQDSSVFTITPLGEDSATTETATLTFKVSDGISFGSGTTTFSLTFITTIENSNYTTFLLKADAASTDNQVDASTNTHTITENGNVTSTALSPYHPGGYSTYFDGSGDYLDIPSSSDFQFGTGAFTVECWFYAEDLDFQGGSVYPHLVCINSYTNGIYLRPKHDGTLYEVYVGNTLYTFTTTIEENVWTHVAVVRDASGNLKLFENGIQIGTTQTGVNYNISTNSSNNRIGSAIHAAAEEFKGYIRDVRVTNTAVYDSDFTAPTETLTAISGTVLLACHLPYIADGSSSDHTITVNGNISTKRFGPYDYEPYTKADYGGSVYFDGTGDNLGVAGNSDFNIGSNFTFECWCYSTSAASGSPGDLLMLVWDGSSNNSVWVSYTSSNKFEFRISYVGGWAMTLTSAGTFPINQWYHVAATRNSGTTYLFINGVQEATGSNSTNISSTGNVVSIGSQGTGRYFQGYIADARIINGTAVYTSAFTPPTAPLTAVTNTKLLTCTNKNNIWDATVGNNITKTGNVTASNTQRKFTGSSAIYFDGAGDYLNGDDMGLGGAGAFTVEAWMYPTVYNTYANDIYSHGANLSVGTDFLAFGINSSGNVQMFKGSGSPALISTSAPCASLNQWYHVAFVRESNNNTSAYVNGVLVAGPTSISGDLTTAPSGRAFIGTQSYSAGATDRSFEGYMQDVRVTKGLARYTSNFTTPAAEFDA